MVEHDRPGQVGGRHRATSAPGGGAGERDHVAHPPGGARGGRGDGRGGRGAGADRERVGARETARVGHAQPHRAGAAGRVVEAGLRRGRVVIGAVAVEVPGVGELVAVWIRRGRAVEVHVQRGGAAGGVRARMGGRGMVVRDRVNALDRAGVGVRVEEVAGRAHLDVHRPARVLDERLTGGRVRDPVRVGEHHPDAAARVVGEEQRAVVLARERAAVVELHARQRGAARRAALRGDLGRVVVGVQRRCDRRRAGRVQVLADVHVQVVVRGVAPRALVTGPAEVLDRRCRTRKAIDLLPGVPAHVADVDVVRAGPDREAVRVAQAVGHDPARVRVRAGRVRVVGHRGAGVRVHANDRAVQGLGIRRGARVLAAQGAALRGGRADGAPGGITAGVDGIALLAVVGELEAGAVAGARIERAVGSEREGADRVARILLAPVLDQHLLRAAGQLREPAAHHAAVPVGTRRGRDSRRPTLAPCRRSRRRACTARTRTAGPW